MYTYSSDEAIPRRGTESIKWDRPEPEEEGIGRIGKVLESL